MKLWNYSFMVASRRTASLYYTERMRQQLPKFRPHFNTCYSDRAVKPRTVMSNPNSVESGVRILPFFGPYLCFLLRCDFLFTCRYCNWPIYTYSSTLRIKVERWILLIWFCFEMVVTYNYISHMIPPRLPWNKLWLNSEIIFVYVLWIYIPVDLF